MQTREEVFEQLKGLLGELFEIKPERVVPGAHLFKDLDIDSIDAIDLMMHLKELTGKKIQPETFKHVRTVQDVVDAVASLMTEESTK
ncbi:MAG TPA: acyl carrier protein [Steroidobacteraceae bacterium]|nr:acyl carrier protein [Steroidobacteraceae bacterium]